MNVFEDFETSELHLLARSLRSWVDRGLRKCRVALDIGGTNAILAFLPSGITSPLVPTGSSRTRTGFRSRARQEGVRLKIRQVRTVRRLLEHLCTVSDLLSETLGLSDELPVPAVAAVPSADPEEDGSSSGGDGGGGLSAVSSSSSDLDGYSDSDTETSRSSFAECACLSLAGPITSSTATETISRSRNRVDVCVRLSNYDPSDCVLESSRLPQFLFPVPRTWFLNDMISCCWGLIALGRRSSGFGRYFDPECLFDGPQKKRESVAEAAAHRSHGSCPTLPSRLLKYTYLCLNMATGLGSALIQYDRLYHLHRPMPLELGHWHLPLALSPLDVKVRKWISENFIPLLRAKRGVSEEDEPFILPEVEDVCSGLRAVANLYYCFAELELIRPKPSVVVPKTFNPFDETFIRSFDVGLVLDSYPIIMEYQWMTLLRVAQQAAVAFPDVKAVILCGRNVTLGRNHAVLKDSWQKMRDAFLSVGPRAPWVKPIRCYIQKKLLPEDDSQQALDELVEDGITTSRSYPEEVDSLSPRARERRRRRGVMMNFNCHGAFHYASVKMARLEELVMLGFSGPPDVE